MFKIIITGITLCVMLFGFSNAHTTEVYKNIFTGEFELSDSEKEEVEEFFKYMTISGSFELNKAIDAAHNGNAIAMYTIGQCYLGGIAGASINRQAANLNFKMAASLGYAPAIFEIFQMYAKENKDPLLAFVYLNMTISMGHKEYRDFYYQQTDLLSKLAGKNVVHEIESIALKKMIKITKMQNEVENRKNTYKPALKLIANNITSDDDAYSEKYWKQFFESQASWEQFFGINP